MRCPASGCGDRNLCFSKKPALAIFLISLPFFVAAIVASVVLTNDQYNSYEATDWVLVGGLRSDSVTFKVRTPDNGPSGPARTLTVSTSSDETDADSVVHAQPLVGTGPVESVTVTGLASGTKHYYYVTTATSSSSDDGDGNGTTSQQQAQVARRGTFRTPQPEGTRFDFRAATGGCALTGSKAGIFRHIAADDPLLFLHLGDFHYEDLNVDDVDVRIGAIDKVLGSDPQADLFGSVGFTTMWDDHDWIGDESRGEGIGRDAALESYRVAFPYHGPLPASRMEAYEGQEEVPPYHAFTVGTVRFVISDLRSESTDERMYSDEQKRWLFDEISNATSYDFVVWVTPSPWIGEPKKDDTWWGHVDDRSELSDYITSTIGGPDGPKNLIAVASDAHMVGFDDGRNTYYGTSAVEEGLSPEEIYSFPILQSGPLDRMGSAKGGPYSDGCNTMEYQRNFQYSTLDFQFGAAGGEEEACIEIKSYSVSDPTESSTKEEIFSKRLCGEIFNSIETAGTGSCESTIMSSGNLAMVVIAGVLGLMGIVLSFCSGLDKCKTTKISVVIILSYFVTYLLGIGIPAAMGAYGNFDIMPVAAISLAQMLTVCVYLYCWRKKEKATREEGAAEDDKEGRLGEEKSSGGEEGDEKADAENEPAASS